MSEAVTHPKHYNSGKIEVIEAIEDWRVNFHRGNAIKYIARAGKKDPAKEIEDLEKAIWYLEREKERLIAIRDGREAIKPNDMNPRVSIQKQFTASVVSMEDSPETDGIKFTCFITGKDTEETRAEIALTLIGIINSRRKIAVFPYV